MLSRYNKSMNLENGFAEHHEAPERFPSQEEITSAFETILGHKSYTELRLRSDKNEVHLYEIGVVLENGEKREYNFQRAKYGHREKSLPAGAKFSASIHVTRYNSEGMPYDGQCVANYLDGTWQYIPETT